MSEELPAHDAVQDRSGARALVPEALRADVRRLGALLGRVLVESGGEDLLADVERLRELVIAAIEEGEQHLAGAAQLVDSLSPRRAEEVARAFTCYFHLANLAEEYHRVRALRGRDTRDGPSRRDDTLAGAVRRLADEVGEERAVQRLAGLEFHPVLTAHPTEARRRAISSAIRRVSELLAAWDDPRLGAHGHIAL
ncbi:MAG TPA: phosphoenolpyruvate carboxylase, partial [Actinomycetaceae bacterium]|nr:phosphoenolpyruvate carboxylase [Actinomycetaceae bacterium]